MSWFRRNKNPAGSQEYLRTSDNVNRPLAAFVTLLLIFAAAAIIFGLFMGGRWLVNNLDGSDQQPSTIATTPVTDITPESSSTTTGTSSNSSSSSSPASGSNSTSQSSSSATNTSSTSTTGGSSSSASSATSQTASTTPTTGAQSETATAIPATGPAETLLLFVAASVVAMLGYQVWLRRSYNS